MMMNKMIFNKETFSEILILLNECRQKDSQDIPQELIENLLLSESEHLSDVNNSSLSATRKIIKEYLMGLEEDVMV